MILPRIVDMLRLALAAIGLTILLIGMPILLWTVAQTLTFPSSVDWFHVDENVQAPPFSQQFSDWAYHTYHALRLGLGADGLVVVLTLAIGAAAWLGIAWLTLVELVLLARDGTMLLVERARLAGPRGWIASLLATLALSTSAHTATAASAAPTTTATAPPQPGTPDHAGPESDTACDATTRGGYTDPPPTTPTTQLPDELRPDCPRYRVHAGDTLTRIATQHLGDAARWRELAELNQPWLANPNQLTPGWQLLLPTDTPSPGQPEVTEITVARGDTLASLAARHLGDANRIGEIYNLNVGRTQPDGLHLAGPDILLPGWKLLVLLDSTASHVDAVPAPPSTDAIEHADPPAPKRVSPANAPGRAEASDAVSTSSSSTVAIAGGGLLALGVASAVVAAMRRQRRARDHAYRPGSGDRTEPPAPGPAVYALRIAADQHTTHDAEDRTASDPPRGLDPGELDIGVREGRTRAVDLAALHGLGLTGSGAEATVRALLVQLLATTHATVLIPEQDAHTLLGTELPTSPRLQLAADEHEAAEELAHRTASNTTPDELGTEQHVHTVVVAEARRAPDQLHTLLAHDTPGVAGLLLGSWPTGATLRIRDDGLVTHTDPELGELREVRLFHLNSTDTRDLLDLFTDTDTSLPEDHPESGDEATPSGAGPRDESTDEAAVSYHVIHPLHDHELDVEQAGLTASDDCNATPFGTGPLAEEEQDADRGTDPTPVPTAEHEPATNPVNLAVLGTVTLTWHAPNGSAHDVTTELAPKHKALLVFLALHPKGTSRETTREALWPDARGSRPYNAYYAALSQLRKTLSDTTDEQASDLVLQHDEHLALNPNLVTVDYWQLTQAQRDLHRAGTPEHRYTAWTRIAAVYRGELGGDMSALWLDAPREATHRTAVDALVGMATHHRSDPQRQLQLLEHARSLNPHNEDLYRRIIRVQAELGLTDGISRTVHLLTTTLAEIGERPTPKTLELARALQAQLRQTAR